MLCSVLVAVGAIVKIFVTLLKKTTKKKTKLLG